MSKSRRSALAVCVFLLLSTLTVPATAATPGNPRLQLRAASPSVDVFRYGKGPVWLDLGISLVARDAPFDLRVRRESYDDPIRIWQAFHRPTGVEMQELPSEIVAGWSGGLSRFLRVALFDRTGTTLLRRRIPDVCVAGWQAERVDDSGPFDPTYPSGCGYSPLTMGSVWGIDEGWAVTPSLSVATMRIPDGRYRAKVSIAPAYRSLFGIAPEDAAVDIAVRVRTSTDCRFCPGAPDASLGAPRRTLTPAPITTDPDADTVPDLVALPAFGIGILHHRGHDYLAFGANVWDRGPSSLVVEGFRAQGEARMDAFQYFLRDGAVVGKAAVGSFEFDDRNGHQHWHFLQFAQYRLLDASQANIVRSHKQSFCLAPTDPLDLTVDGAVWRPDQTGFSSCGSPTSIWIREVLPTGWGDTYFQGVAGQGFDVTALPNGTYWIEVHANPLGLLYDGDHSNDVELREVILGGRPGARRVTVPPFHGIDTETGFFGF